jgi:hypothetical protein
MPLLMLDIKDHSMILEDKEGRHNRILRMVEARKTAQLYDIIRIPQIPY